MLVQHIRYKDGREEHREFSRDTWEDAMHDPTVARQWGHPPDRCFDPVQEVRASMVVGPPAEAPISRAAAIAQKEEQLRKLIEEYRKPAQLTLELGDTLD